jgi:hypothetical protein
MKGIKIILPVFKRTGLVVKFDFINQPLTQVKTKLNFFSLKLKRRTFSTQVELDKTPSFSEQIEYLKRILKAQSNPKDKRRIIESLAETDLTETQKIITTKILISAYCHCEIDDGLITKARNLDIFNFEDSVKIIADHILAMITLNPEIIDLYQSSISTQILSLINNDRELGIALIARMIEKTSFTNEALCNQLVEHFIYNPKCKTLFRSDNIPANYIKFMDVKHEKNNSSAILINLLELVMKYGTLSTLEKILCQRTKSFNDFFRLKYSIYECFYYRGETLEGNPLCVIFDKLPDLFRDFSLQTTSHYIMIELFAVAMLNKDVEMIERLTRRDIAILMTHPQFNELFVEYTTKHRTQPTIIRSDESHQKEALEEDKDTVIRQLSKENQKLQQILYSKDSFVKKPRIIVGEYTKELIEEQATKTRNTLPKI